MSKIFLLYIQYINLYFIYSSYSSYVIIPFKVQDYTYGNSDTTIMKYIYKDILVKFSVGSPPQPIHLSACLGEFSTFILSNEFEDSTYKNDNSKTYKALSSEPESYYFQLYSSAIKSKDNFIIEESNTLIRDLTFNLVNEINDNSQYCSYCDVITQSGILGLLIAQMKNFEENVYETNFINQLKNKNLISSYDFFFDFESSNSGNIIIGIKPDELFKDEKYNEQNYVTIKTSTSRGDLDWSIKFDQIHYGNIKMNQTKPMILRIEFGLITGYYEWKKVLEKEFFSKLIEAKKCFKEYTNQLGSYLDYFICNKNTDLSGFQPFTFTINEFDYNFTLTKDDLFLDTGDKYLFLMAFGGFSELILGLPFIKKYQLILNPNTKTVGFYQGDKERDLTFLQMLRRYIIIISVLAVVLLGLLVVAFLFYWQRKKNKKNATELLDEVNNENQIIEDNKIIDDTESAIN